MDSERPPWTRYVLFSIANQFPKLDVAGSIPVSRSFQHNNLQESLNYRLQNGSIKPRGRRFKDRLQNVHGFESALQGRERLPPKNPIVKSSTQRTDCDGHGAMPSGR